MGKWIDPTNPVPDESILGYEIKFKNVTPDLQAEVRERLLRYKIEKNIISRDEVRKRIYGNYYDTTLPENTEMQMSNDVEHPAHYNQYEGFEVIDVCKQLGFIKGNAFKYIARAGYKPVGDLEAELKDLRKARFYIQLEIARVETEILTRKKIEELDVPSIQEHEAARQALNEETAPVPSSYFSSHKVTTYRNVKDGKIIKAIQYNGVNFTAIESALGRAVHVSHPELRTAYIEVEGEDGEILRVPEKHWFILGEEMGQFSIMSDYIFYSTHTPR